MFSCALGQYLVTNVGLEAASDLWLSLVILYFGLSVNLMLDRFIDDIFMIWPHSEDELDKFIIHMNNQNKSIQFTHEKRLTEITFLDVIVSKQYDLADSDSQIKLSTRTHIKNTNKQLYVKNESYHPPGTGKGIIIGEAISYLRTNSSSNSFHKMIHKHISQKRI